MPVPGSPRKLAPFIVRTLGTAWSVHNGLSSDTRHPARSVLGWQGIFRSPRATLIWPPALPISASARSANENKNAPVIANPITMKGVRGIHQKVVILTLIGLQLVSGAKSQFGSGQAIFTCPASKNRWRMFGLMALRGDEPDQRHRQLIVRQELHTPCNTM